MSTRQLKTGMGLMTTLVLTLMTAQAANRYVSLGGTNDSAGGYTTWSGAATQIQWAVSAAGPGDTILVSNGTFKLTNNLVLNQAYTLRGLNGRDYSVINGAANYHIDIEATVVFDGLTMSNGFGDVGAAGGIYVNQTSSKIINSKITDCSYGYGAGMYLQWSSATVSNCIIQNNNNYLYAYAGGMVIAYSTAAIKNCQIINNSGGPGIYLYYGDLAAGPATISDCIISNNSSDSQYKAGGIFFRNGAAIVRNCLIVNNHTPDDSAYGTAGISADQPRLFGSAYAQIVNCTIAGNYGKNGGVYIGGPNNADLFINCIISSNFTNSAFLTPLDVVMGDTTQTNAFLNCCLTNDLPADRHSITSNPAFVNFPNNYRLRMSSPAVNAGTIQSWMTNGVDLDGRARILNGMVDMGAYETLAYKGTVIRVR